MTYALPGNRLTWNVAVPWPEADLRRLGNQRYITANGGPGDSQGKLDRWAKHTLSLFGIGS